MYNLLVTSFEGAWRGRSYEMPVERFGEYTEDELRQRYALPLTDESRAELESLPTLFAYEGSHDVHIGQIKSIGTNRGSLRVRFFLSDVSIPAEKFSDLRHALDIGSAWEMSRTHWAIKDVDLAEVLLDAGLDVPSFLAGNMEGSLAPVDRIEESANVGSQLPALPMRFVRRIGNGAFGTVWEAYDELLERSIAIKFLTSTDEAYDESALLREARSLARISHPNLVAVFGAAKMPHPETRLAAPAIMMELLHGENLDDWWAVVHAPGDVLRVARCIVDGISAMHKGRLVHGDLHPKNIVVVNDAIAKIIDWRYQDAGLMKMTTYNRNETEAESRRVYDLIESLFDAQDLEMKGQFRATFPRASAGSLTDWLTWLRSAEAALLVSENSFVMTSRPHFRNEAVGMVVQHVYTEGPITRWSLLGKGQELRLTRTGIQVGIDAGLEDGLLVEGPDFEGVQALTASEAGRAAVMSTAADTDLYLASSDRSDQD